MSALAEVTSIEGLRSAPKQQRSTVRLQSILDTGREVLAEVGRDRLTTAMVAERAGMSIGTFYRYFVDRVALLDVILTIDTEEQIAELPEGSVLLCAVNEVFWLPPNQLERRWLAAGYDPVAYSWTDDEVAHWAPLRILHRGS